MFKFNPPRSRPRRCRWRGTPGPRRAPSAIVAARARQPPATPPTARRPPAPVTKGHTTPGPQEPDVLTTAASAAGARGGSKPK
eukprot:8475350-Pyramimonas_sp.AAC.1